METPDETKSLFDADKKLTFLFLCIATYFLLFLKIVYIENETATFEFLADRPEGSVLQILSALKFVSVPLVYLWKFTVIGFVIWIGCFLFGYRVSFGECWGVAVVAEYIFLVPELMKVIWFFFIETDPTYTDVRSFYPFSLMSFFDYDQINTKYAYPLRALNLFEIIYWFLLVEGIHFFVGRRKAIAWMSVLFSYGILFFVWLWFYTVMYAK